MRIVPDGALETRSGLFEELDFLRGGRAAQNGIAVRKAPKARDDVVMFLRPHQQIGAPQCSELVCGV